MFEESVYENKFDVDVERDLSGKITNLQKREKNDPLVKKRNKVLEEKKMLRNKKKLVCYIFPL